jgi:predicted ATP-dependent protease
MANGGYLLLDAVKLLTQPFAWEGLKRALATHEIRIESLGQMYSLVSTMSLEPGPIPLSTKVILLGNRLLYYPLNTIPSSVNCSRWRPISRTRWSAVRTMTCCTHAWSAPWCAGKSSGPRDRGAVARVIDHSARLTEDAEKLSTHMESLADLVRQADYWATQIKRSDRLRQRSHEAILRGILHIDTEGEQVG